MYGGADETEHPLYAASATIDRTEEEVEFSSVFRVEGRNGIDGIDGLIGGRGAQGKFYVILYQNTEDAPATPTTITYTFETEALANLGDWSVTRTTPGAGEDTYTIETIVDPDTEDESVTPSFNTPVNITTAEAVPPATRRIGYVPSINDKCYIRCRLRPTPDACHGPGGCCISGWQRRC